MIENWRLSWVRSGSDPYLPFGFVHLGNFINGQDGVDIRWHQTFDKGFVNGTVDKRFMAVAMDTYDKKGGIHPRYKSYNKIKPLNTISIASSDAKV